MVSHFLTIFFSVVFMTPQSVLSQKQQIVLVFHFSFPFLFITHSHIYPNLAQHVVRCIFIFYLFILIRP